MSVPVDVTRVQRALFLAQLSPRGARTLFEADADAARRELELGAAELALLRALDPVAVAADRHGKRADQLLGNATSEFRLSRAVALRAAPSFLEDFLDDDAFRDAILHGRALPLAFGAYAAARAEREGAEELAELLRLERAMAHARRAPRDVRAPRAGEVALAPEARTVELAAGTLARAEAVRAALDEDATPPPWSPASDARETVLLVVPARPRHGLPDVTAERLEPLVAALLAAAHEPLGETERDAFTRARDIRRADLDAFVEELVDEGVLVRGA